MPGANTLFFLNGGDFDWLAVPAGVQVIDLNGEVSFPQGGSQCIRITPGLQQGVI